MSSTIEAEKSDRDGVTRHCVLSFRQADALARTDVLEADALVIVSQSGWDPGFDLLTRFFVTC